MNDLIDYYSAEAATFGDRLAGARERAGMSQKQLAKRLGIRTSTLKSWEDDLNEPRANRLSILAGLLNVSIMWLINGEGEGMDAPEEATTLSGDAQEVLTELRDLRAELKRRADQAARLEKRLKALLRESEDA